MDSTELDDVRDAFYDERRTEQLPLAVNDIVTVQEGRRSGARAWLISLESLLPQPKYLIEFKDGSDEIVSLEALHLDEPNA